MFPNENMGIEMSYQMQCPHAFPEGPQAANKTNEDNQNAHSQNDVDRVHVNGIKKSDFFPLKSGHHTHGNHDTAKNLNKKETIYVCMCVCVCERDFRIKM